MSYEEHEIDHRHRHMEHEPAFVRWWRKVTAPIRFGHEDISHDAEDAANFEQTPEEELKQLKREQGNSAPFRDLV